MAIRRVQGKAISRRDPLIIHTGTNHVQKESVKSIIRRLEHLESNLLYHRYQRVALSNIVYLWYVRKNIAAVNDIIVSICARNGWAYIDNDDVDETCIEHSDCFHPNREIRTQPGCRNTPAYTAAESYTTLACSGVSPLSD